jgi:aminopeptidase N
MNGGVPGWAVRVAVLVVGLFAAGREASADTYPRQLALDVLHYAFSIGLSDATDQIDGEATVDLRFVREGALGFELDLANATPERQGRGMVVSAVTRGAEPLTFEHAGDRLRVTLATPSRRGERASFTVRYHGTPASGLLIGKNKHGDRTFFSDDWPNKARHWLPTLDHPYDKASCEFRVTAPAHYQVVSNGLRVEETDLPGERRLTHWRQSVPIATWLYVLGVSPFAVQRLGEHEGRAVETWVFPQDRDQGFFDFAEPTLAVLDFFSRKVGPYSYEKLANVQANGVRGGMESATAIFYGDDSVTGKRSPRWRNVVIHEIAHQWFGNAVTEADWDDVWLSEGFATYFTSLFIEHAYGREAFLESLKASRDAVRAFETKRPGYRIVHDNLSDMTQVTTRQTYDKGGFTLHMLRGLMGDEAFWRGIRDYYARYRDGNATTDDFRRTMEEASGRELGWFFDQWLRRGGLPALEGSWRYDVAAHSLEVELRQLQPGEPFRLPIDLALVGEGTGEPAAARIELLEKNQTFRLPLEREPREVRLDPQQWLLTDAVRFTMR